MNCLKNSSFGLICKEISNGAILEVAASDWRVILATERLISAVINFSNRGNGSSSLSVIHEFTVEIQLLAHTL